MSNKHYKSEAARRMAEAKEQQRRKAEEAKRTSKKFTGGSNPHLGASRSQSGQQRQG